MKNEGWLGIVRWCDEDFACKLEGMGLALSYDNISAVRCYLENGHRFHDAMVEAGFAVIGYAIGEVVTT